MKKTRIIAVLLVLVMACAVILAACSTEYTVTYVDKTTNQTVGTETVKKGATASGRVSGYVLNSNLTLEDGSVYDLDTPVTADITLYGYFMVTESWLNPNEKNYTYRMATSDLPTAWNYHTYETASSTYVLDYSSDSLYTFDYNDTEDGFVIIPSMAAGDPVDVTSQYVGKYGISAGDTGKAYSIPLKTNLRYDNGDAINANSFVRSMYNLLEPNLANFRADNAWSSGSLKIYGAENYAKQGSIALEDITGGEGVLLNDDGDSDWGNVAEDVQKELVFSSENCYVYGWFAANGYNDYDPPYSAAFILSYYLCEEASEDDILALDGKTLYEILNDEDLLWVLEDLIAGWCTDPGEEFGFFCQEVTWDSYDFADVGFFATDDYTLVIVLKNAMEDNFYLRYELCTSFFLVYNPLYEACINRDSIPWTNSYGTSIEKYVGYGPYKLTYYLADSSMKLTRNEYWHGYYEEELEGLYQTTAIQYTVVKEDATILEMFLKGELDSYGLRADDMEDYISSKYTYFNDSESTWFVAMNPDQTTYETTQATATPVTAGNTVIKTPLIFDEFRQAMSYSLDRAGFILSCNPTSGIAKALLSSMMVSDPDNGVMYRNTDEAKDAILEFWGLADAWGPGKEYATRDEAIESITGYDPAGAKTLFTTAYNMAVEAGFIPEGNNWELQIMIGASNWSSTFYSRGYDFLTANWIAAVEGTPWEGHLTFAKSENLGSSGFADALHEGRVDLLFGVGYSGSQFDPYSFMECFTGNLQYDVFTDMSKIYCDIEWNGQVLRASVKDWIENCLQGNKISAVVVVDGEETSQTVEISAGVNDESALRLLIMAKTEVTILNQCNLLPLMTDASASLRCMRINYKTEEYILGVGRGGIQYYTYSYSDEEFADFVASQGGTLNYKATE